MPEFLIIINFKMILFGGLFKNSKNVEMLKHITLYLGKQNRKLIVSLNWTFKIIRSYTISYHKILNYEKALRNPTLSFKTIVDIVTGYLGATSITAAAKSFWSFGASTLTLKSSLFIKKKKKNHGLRCQLPYLAVGRLWGNRYTCSQNINYRNHSGIYSGITHSFILCTYGPTYMA